MMSSQGNDEDESNEIPIIISEEEVAVDDESSSINSDHLSGSEDESSVESCDLDAAPERSNNSDALSHFEMLRSRNNNARNINRFTAKKTRWEAERDALSNNGSVPSGREKNPPCLASTSNSSLHSNSPMPPTSNDFGNNLNSNNISDENSTPRNFMEEMARSRSENRATSVPFPSRSTRWATEEEALAEENLKSEESDSDQYSEEDDDDDSDCSSDNNIKPRNFMEEMARSRSENRAKSNNVPFPPRSTLWATENAALTKEKFENEDLEIGEDSVAPSISVPKNDFQDSLDRRRRSLMRQNFISQRNLMSQRSILTHTQSIKEHNSDSEKDVEQEQEVVQDIVSRPSFTTPLERSRSRSRPNMKQWMSQRSMQSQDSNDAIRDIILRNSTSFRTLSTADQTPSSSEKPSTSGSTPPVMTRLPSINDLKTAYGNPNPETGKENLSSSFSKKNLGAPGTAQSIGGNGASLLDKLGHDYAPRVYEGPAGTSRSPGDNMPLIYDGGDPYSDPTTPQVQTPWNRDQCYAVVAEPVSENNEGNEESITMDSNSSSSWRKLRKSMCKNNLSIVILLVAVLIFAVGVAFVALATRGNIQDTNPVSSVINQDPSTIPVSQKPSPSPSLQGPLVTQEPTVTVTDDSESETETETTVSSSSSSSSSADPTVVPELSLTPTPGPNDTGFPSPVFYPVLPTSQPTNSSSDELILIPPFDDDVATLNRTEPPKDDCGGIFRETFFGIRGIETVDRKIPPEYSQGCMFNVEAKSFVGLTGVRLSFETDDEYEVFMYTRSGTYAPYEADSEAWEIVNEFPKDVKGKKDHTYVEIYWELYANVLKIDEGETQAFYINARPKGGRSGGMLSQEIDSEKEELGKDGALTITGGICPGFNFESSASRDPQTRGRLAYEPKKLSVKLLYRQVVDWSSLNVFGLPVGKFIPF